jgi:hypothetical protein
MAPSPIANFLRFTGGLAEDRSAFAIYGYGRNRSIIRETKLKINPTMK